MYKFALLALVAANDPDLEMYPDHNPEACTEWGEPDPDCCAPPASWSCTEPWVVDQGSVCFEGGGPGSDTEAFWYRCLPAEEEMESAFTLKAVASLMVTAAALF